MADLELLDAVQKGPPKRIIHIISLLSEDDEDLTNAMDQEDAHGNNTFMIAIKNEFITSVDVGGAFIENISRINHENKKGKTALALLEKSKMDSVLKNALIDKIKRNGGKYKRKSSTKKRKSKSLKHKKRRSSRKH